MAGVPGMVLLVDEGREEDGSEWSSAMAGRKRC